MQIPAAVKAEYLRRLIAAGFKHIDAVSFVSPAAIPQMADSEQVLEDLMPQDVEIIGIVVNEKGAGAGYRYRRSANSRLSLFHFPPVSRTQSEANSRAIVG